MKIKTLILTESERRELTLGFRTVEKRYLP
jgi:hypothetical protein